jgi:C-terminal processing protease CtpA/Prc
MRGKIAVLTSSRSVSYAETFITPFATDHTAEIFGSQSAGGNGNINPFILPGGLMINWTGMRVTSPDGKVQTGVGITPTRPVTATRTGLAAGRDEVLEAAVSWILDKPRP